MLGVWAWAAIGLQAQCKLAFDEVDAFDKTHTILAKPINIGYMVPSNFQTAEGNKMVEEAKLVVAYSESDSINSFFLSIAVLEWDYQSIESDRNVLLLLENEEVITLLNVADRGEFNADTNMRLYEHVCVIPMDIFFALSHFKVQKIRIQYKNYKRTLTLTPEQQEAIRKAVLCVGEASKLFPVKP